jgi:hypothetical protein
MIYKEHTRNQKRMYRIHKQEEKIQEQELIIASLQQRIDKAIEYIEQLPFNDLVPLEVKVIYEILGDKE